MHKTHTYNSALAVAIAAALLSACSSSSNNTTTPGSNAVVTVEAALADFPNALLPRFALSNSEVTAAEVFRRAEYSANGDQVVSWGVEGASDDELLELESRYGSDSILIESIRNDVLDTLPDAINTALLARYPDAVISEIARSTSVDGAAYAILFETMGEEIEANYDDSAALLFVEDVEEREGIPANVLTMADAQGVTLPDSEFEIITYADDTVEYAVEYENESGQSITIAMNAVGDIIRVEHEDALSNLSTSDTVAEALANFPAGIEADFATMFSEVTAAEIFRSKDLSASAQGELSYGIEGLSADETLEIEALYTSEVVLLEQGRGEIIDTLPANVDAAFTTRYPGVSIEEIARATDDDGVSYAILFQQNGEELEANYNDAAEFLALEDVLEEAEIPSVILDTIGAERVLLPIVEFEQVTAADGTLSYAAEYENDDGDSISYKLDANGTILKIDHEAALTN